MQVDMTLIGALGIAVTTLAGVVGYMGQFFMKEFQSVKAEVHECRSDREKLWERLADINRKIDRQNGGH